MAVFAAALLIAYLSLYPALFAAIQARLVRAFGRGWLLLAPAIWIASEMGRTYVARRFSVGAARLQPGDGRCRSRRSPASSASTACRDSWRWSAPRRPMRRSTRSSRRWRVAAAVALLVIGDRGVGHAAHGAADALRAPARRCGSPCCRATSCRIRNGIPRCATRSCSATSSMTREAIGRTRSSSSGPSRRRRCPTSRTSRAAS